MEVLLSKDFWRCALVRMIKTVAQTFVSLVPMAVGINEVDWLMVGGTSVVAGVLSIFTSIATGLPEVELKDKEAEDE